MIYGIFSDVHANLTALEAVLISMDSHGVELRASLGDIVGYGPDVNQCVSLVSREAANSVLGNHDNVALGRESSRQFNRLAREAILWTRGQLSQESSEYLSGLPLLDTVSSCTLVHGLPSNPAGWRYLEYGADAKDAAMAIDTCLCACGHTHRPALYHAPADVWPVKVDIAAAGSSVVEYGPLTLDGGKVIFCVGAVGQPRNYHSRASWCLVDTGRMTIEYVRVPYDVASVQRRMELAGLPAPLISRLGEGC